MAVDGPAWLVKSRSKTAADIKNFLLSNLEGAPRVARSIVLSKLSKQLLVDELCNVVRMGALLVPPPAAVVAAPAAAVPMVLV